MVLDDTVAFWGAAASREISPMSRRGVDIQSPWKVPRLVDGAQRSPSRAILFPLISRTETRRMSHISGWINKAGTASMRVFLTRAAIFTVAVVGWCSRGSGSRAAAGRDGARGRLGGRRLYKPQRTSLWLAEALRLARVRRWGVGAHAGKGWVEGGGHLRFSPWSSAAKK